MSGATSASKKVLRMRSGIAMVQLATPPAALRAKRDPTGANLDAYFVPPNKGRDEQSRGTTRGHKE